MDGVVSEGNEARFAADIEALGAVLDHADLQEPDARLLLGAVDADRARRSVEPIAAVSWPCGR